MPTCFLIFACIAIVVGSSVYIALMNRQWWGRKPDDPKDEPPR